VSGLFQLTCAAPTAARSGCGCRCRHGRPVVESVQILNSSREAPMLRRVDDNGFTLIELLATTVISAHHLGGGAGLYVGLRTTSVTNRRLAESHDAQFAAAWFVTDVRAPTRSTSPRRPRLHLQRRDRDGARHLQVDGPGHRCGQVVSTSRLPPPAASAREVPASSSSAMLPERGGRGNDVTVAHLLDAPLRRCSPARRGPAPGLPHRLPLPYPVDATLYAPTPWSVEEDTQ